MNISFKPLAMEDLPLMHRWLQQPLLVDIWSNGKALSLEEVAEKYGPRIREEGPDSPYLILCDGVPIGYINTYLWSSYPEYQPYLEPGEDAASLDVFIGEEEYRGRGIGTAMLRQFLREVVFARAETVSCVITPEARNEAALRVYERAGFKRWRVVEPPFEAGPICLMRVGRGEV